MKRIDFILPIRFIAITPPVEVMAVTKDHEFLNQMLLIICSFPFGIHEKLFFVSLEKEVSSTFISILKLWITFHNRMENHCLVQA